ncbi:c-type cytochrome [Achromobacter anxifer]
MAGHKIAPTLAWGLALSLLSIQAHADFGNLGHPATAEEVAGWNIDISADGKGLPQGQGTIEAGAKLYQTACIGCHGVKLEGGLGPALAGGMGSLASDKPLKTVGSYWPYATTLFDYIRRAMPFQAPQSLTDEEVYSLTAYLLHENGVIPAGTVMNAKTLPAVRMPNRDGFYVDDRPDTKDVRCMSDCLPASAPFPKP